MCSLGERVSWPLRDHKVYRKSQTCQLGTSGPTTRWGETVAREPGKVLPKTRQPRGVAFVT